MIGTFRVSDALRCIMLNTPQCPNLASTNADMARHSTLQNLGLWKQALTQQENRITLASWNGIKLAGLVSARTSSGRVWEVDYLYLPYSGSNGAKVPIAQEATALRLLEGLIKSSGKRRAERMLLRLPSNTAVKGLAQRAGFFPYAEETLMQGSVERVSLNGDRSTELYRVRQAQDDYGLFQLFSASTPSSVRVAMGLTCDQWQEVQSLWPNSRQEWVTRQDGRIVGWLGLFNHKGWTEGKVMAHPNHPELIEALTKFALSRPGYQRWLVPDYQEPVCDQLSYRGLQETARYTMLINTVAAPVMCSGMAPVEA